MIRYQDILNYLESIAAESGQVDGAPHGVWWKPDGTNFLSYDQFKTGKVPNVGADVNIIKIDEAGHAEQSPFYQILAGPIEAGGKHYGQMPLGGPFITDSEGTVTFTLPDGSTITGKQIQENIKHWLNNGIPE
jgi:hypothetical protein